MNFLHSINSQILSGLFFTLSLFLSHASINENVHAETKPELKFIVLGDWGGEATVDQKAVAKQMVLAADREKIDFVVTTGDNFYCDGVLSVDDDKWETGFEQIYSSESLMVPWYVSLGNHDYRGNIQAQIDYSQRSKRWHLPSRYYSIVKKIDDTASAQFIFLDTTPFIKSYYKERYRENLLGQDPEVQLAWLEKTLAASTSKWKIVIGHHPIYSGGPKYKNTWVLIKKLVPIFKKHKVQAYICGHEHNLQHLIPKRGIHYFVSGAGGKAHKIGNVRKILFYKRTFGFLIMTLEPQRLNAKFIDFTGKVLYTTEVNPSR